MVKRESVGQRLKRARLEQGMSVPQVVTKVLEDHGFDVSASTVRGVEADATPNPGIKTIKAIALGVKLDPAVVIGLVVVGLVLEESPESERGFSSSQLARLWRECQTLTNGQRTFVDQLLTMLMETVDRWRRP